MTNQAHAVLDFWLGDGLAHDWPTQDLNERWFGGDAALDREIDARFGARVREAIAGGLSFANGKPSRCRFSRS